MTKTASLCKPQKRPKDEPESESAADAKEFVADAFCDLLNPQ
jgi:hypothetical protein